MENIQNYLRQLSKRDRLLLVFSIILLSFVVLKFFLIDSLNEKNTKLINKSMLVAQQENLLNKFDGITTNLPSNSTSTNQLINNFLKTNSASKSLTQIRTTNDGAQRFELEDISFTTFVKLLDSLDANSISYSSLQIKKTKKSGVIDAVMTLQ